MFIKSFKLFLTFIFLFVGISFAVHALNVPSAPLGHVSDYADLLSKTTKQELKKTLEEFEKTDSTQIVVAIFPSLEEESLEDFSMRLASTWKIGQKDHDNGVIFLVFKNDRQMRIEVGYGLEDKLTDATSSDIIRNVVVPEFKNGDFDTGVTRGVTAIMQATRGAYLRHSSDDSDISVVGIFMAILLVTFFFALVLMSFIKAAAGKGSHSYTSSGWSHGGFSGGFSSGSSGFSGGGGSFGGGGASGRW